MKRLALINVALILAFIYAFVFVPTLIAQEPASQSPKSPEMEVLELKIQLVRERKEKLQAQFIIASQEEERLTAEYKKLMAKEQAAAMPDPDDKNKK